jgi:spermidine/putrescine transport system substrate-binding protein
MSKSLPEDPLIRSLVQAARSSQISRRGMLLGAAGTIGTASALSLTACAPGGDSADSIIWANWAAYIDEDDEGNYPTLDRFEDESGIRVSYQIDVDDNNTFYAKVKDQLALGQDIGADTVCLTDWMVARLIRFGYVQELDKSGIPNAKNLLPSLQDPGFDPGRKFSLPWQGGFAGLCWNKELYPKGLKNVSDLWDPELKGRVGVLSEMRDTIGLIMAEQGVDISSDFSAADFEKAVDLFREKVESGQIRNIKGNSYLEDLKNEDTIAAIVWSGDVTVINAEAGDKWEFVIPEAGGTLWNDNFIIPIGTKKQKSVEKLIDYYYDPAVAAEVAAWVNYITPVVGAQAEAEKIDPALAENQLIFPNEETLATVKVFRPLSADEEQSFGDLFQSVLLGA